MARRTITVVFDDELQPEEYADRGNAIWSVMKVGHPGGGFHLESDDVTPVEFLNARWKEHGDKMPWQ
jgi:hypothetical protein